MADCILTTFTGVWLKNAGKKKTFPLKGKQMLVPFFCLEGCGSILIAGRECPFVSFHIANESCFLSGEYISPLKGEDLNMAIPQSSLNAVCLPYTTRLCRIRYICLRFKYPHNQKREVCLGKFCRNGSLWGIVPEEMKGFLYYGIPADGLHGFTKQITDRGYCII